MKTGTLLRVSSSVIITVTFFGRTDADQYDKEVEGNMYADHPNPVDYFFVVLPILMASATLLVCLVVMYYTLFEDILMQKYSNEGRPVEARIIAAEFARGGGSDMPPEYVVFVEYVWELQQSYSVMVRKQMRVSENEIKMPASLRDTIKGESSMEDEFDEKNLLRSLLLSKENNGNRWLLSLRVLVIPQYSLSGLPETQVKTKLCFKSRMSTIIFLIIGAVSMLCWLSWAVHRVLHLNEELASSFNMADFGLYSTIILVSLVLVETMFVHFCLLEKVNKHIESEYLNNGDLVPMSYDDSTITTQTEFLESAGQGDVIAWISTIPNTDCVDDDYHLV